MVLKNVSSCLLRIVVINIEGTGDSLMENFSDFKTKITLVQKIQDQDYLFSLNQVSTTRDLMETRLSLVSST